MDQLHLCVATSSVQHLFAKAPISFAFFCPKLAAKHRTGSDGSIRPTSNSHHSGGNTNGGGERGGAPKNGGDKRKRDVDSGAGDKAPGSIINTTGRNIRFPSGLKETYCSHFADTAKVCDFGAKCKHKYAVFLGGCDSDDHKPVLDFVKETRGLKWSDKVTLPRQVSSTNDRN